ncbi:MAG: TusE/DsrC/DsvC family sulfur relay protein [Alcanivoracaceae bacterium]|nr:TusE/DsrC/DsvC family sulfur relay protein [Alcanivoracaceae bacterium]
MPGNNPNMPTKATNTIKLDDNGHLQKYSDWNTTIGEEMAKHDNLILTDEHWQIINLVRDIYLQTETTPPMRLLIKVIKNKLPYECANSRYLYRLFPDGPVRFASKYAGLPKPKHCM